jgi:serine/threonine protein kinase
MGCVLADSHSLVLWVESIPGCWRFTVVLGLDYSQLRLDMVCFLVVTRYELFDRIGVGGMAEIFRGKALAAGGFEKPVAIKRILPHLSQDQRFVQLLIAEAKILSQLRHRNIVQIFDVGVGDDGKYFLVMEFVDGKDLGAIKRALVSRRQRFSVDIVLHLGAELCDALGHAHAAKGADGAPMKLVHRDISPNNVLISRAGEVKLTDFGIAKRADESTGGGGVRGKFAYISPEQARNQHVDARSDVFSTALVLWELCTGQPLFSELSDLEALRGVCDGDIPRPSSIDPSIPAELDGILATALSKDPARRFTGALQFGAKLRSLRYSLPDGSGDPAAELARTVEMAVPILDVKAPKNKPPARSEFDVGEATFIRIRTADAFATGGNDIAALSRARQVIEKFEEEETRMAQVGQGALNRLRDIANAAEKRSRDNADTLPIKGSLTGPEFGQKSLDLDRNTEGLSASVDRNAFANEERTALASASYLQQVRASSGRIDVERLATDDLILEDSGLRSAGLTPKPPRLPLAAVASMRPPGGRARPSLPLMSQPLTDGSASSHASAVSSHASAAPWVPNLSRSPAPTASRLDAGVAEAERNQRAIGNSSAIAAAGFAPPLPSYPRAASPTVRDTDRPHYSPGKLPARFGAKPGAGALWFVIIAFVFIGALAFAITRALLHNR